MSSTRDTEADLMQLTAADLASQGYSVIVQPSATELPPELKQFRPDGIAIGKKPHLVIEVTSERGGHERATKIREALRNNPEWQLYVVFNRSTASEPLALQSLESIERLADIASKVAVQDRRAGLLMCWAALEAIARLIEPQKFGRPQTPGRIVEELASPGYITPSEAASLRKLASIRNSFIHGVISVDVTQNELDEFIDVLNVLIGYYRRNRLNQ